MYLLPDNRQWDSDYFHTLISDKHIISSSEAKAIREKTHPRRCVAASGQQLRVGGTLYRLLLCQRLGSPAGKFDCRPRYQRHRHPFFPNLLSRPFAALACPVERNPVPHQARETGGKR